MKNNYFVKLQQSSYRCLGIKFKNKKTYYKLKLLIKEILKKNIDINKKQDLKNLKTQDLENLILNIQNNYQIKIKRILKNEIDDLCMKFFGKKFPKFRVGVQIKSKWKQNRILKQNKGFLFFTLKVSYTPKPYVYSIDDIGTTASSIGNTFPFFEKT